MMIMHREIMPQTGLYSLLLVAGLLTQHSNVVENKIISSGNKVSVSDMFVMNTLVQK